MRLAAYAGASVVLATGVLLKALHQRSNFYSACVYLSQSSANLMILTNLCLLITGFLLFWLQRLLYGPLRPIETEQLYERAWFAVTETCLAMTIFRGELGAWFLVMFISLLVGKVWGWIGEGRVEFLEQQPPANPKLFHIRLASSLALTVLFDCFMLRYCVHTVITQARPDMMVMFGFEFAILTILSSSTLLRYAIALTEISITRQQVKARVEERRAEIRVARVEAIQESARAGANLPDENDVNELEIDVPGWEEKGRWVFYLDLLTDLLKLVIYLTFFGILLTFYGLPIHILRDVVVTIRSFARRIVDFMRYRNATRDMNQRYPDATVEEVSREDVCIICREEMTPVQPAQPAQPAEGAAEHPAAPPAAGSRHVPERLRPKKLPCGHILHFACLRSWLERQQNCPTCRRPVIAPNRTAGAAGVGGNNAPGQPNGNQAGQPGANGAPRARVLQLGPLRTDSPGQRSAACGEPSCGCTCRANWIWVRLLQIEQRLTHEIQTLRAATEQLTRVRNLQLELDRLRQQGAPGPNPVQSSNTPISAPTPGPNPSVFSARQFVGASSNSVMNSGDARLPEGLTIPPGWTLLPLQRMDNSTGLAQPVPPVPATSVTTETTPASASNSAVPLSDTTSAPHQANGDVQKSTQTYSPPPTVPTPAPDTRADEARADSPSQEWTDLAPKQPLATGSTIPTTWGSGESSQAPASPDERSESPSKGKGRAVTVEETADEEAV
ncbi:Zinc finger RING-type [Penicillium brevicompactum]|uniref:Zinc finger RING-type n=1 Tax=Penicillium brevicompactum TaxID=5074 RepID=UPI0025411419|nr:Zinc finger RING-type [Penicillium brevicompactum]KAJ5348085.1 Zinc finger RING-type [Penicillium brevicompactum]